MDEHTPKATPEATVETFLVQLANRSATDLFRASFDANGARREAARMLLADAVIGIVQDYRARNPER